MQPNRGAAAETARLSRRTILTLCGVSGFGLLAGCLGDDDVPEPETLTEDDSCADCGMVVTHHPGPSGQSFYDDHPDFPDGRAPFCSGLCTYGFTFDQEGAGYEPIVTYLTDYSVVDWDLSEEGDVTFISDHHEAETQREVTDLTFVAGSDVRGSMGEELIGFSASDDAESFRDDHGGELVSHGDVTRELIDSLGGM